jgi:hypothetical protein
MTEQTTQFSDPRKLRILVTSSDLPLLADKQLDRRFLVLRVPPVDDAVVEQFLREHGRLK